MSTSKLPLSLNFRLPSSKAIPAALLLLCSLTYGLFSPWLGLHWDDHSILAAFGDDLISLFSFWGADRPANAIYFYGAQSLFGEIAFLWHIWAVVLRWTGALLVWLLLVEFCEGKRFDCFAIASLFLIFPGFRFQSAAVAFNGNLLHLVLILLSILLMVYSLTNNSKRSLFVCSSVGTGFLSMMLNEYHLGYELFRPVAIWYFINSPILSFRRNIVRVIRAWTPFALMLGAYFLYRVLLGSIERTEVDPAHFFSMVEKDWYQFFVSRIGLVFPNLIEGTFLSWLQAFSAGGHKTGAIYGLFGLPIGMVTGLLWYLYTRPTPQPSGFWSLDLEHQRGQKLLLLGLILFFLGALPLWFAGISASIYDAHGRFTFSVMLGCSVTLFAFIKLVITKPRFQVAIVSLFIVLGVAIQIEAQNDFRRSWSHSKSFFSQLQLRAPALEEGTTLIVDAKVPSWDSTTISEHDLSIPLNILYAGDQNPSNLRYWAIPIGEVDNSRLDFLTDSPLLTPIEVKTRNQNFSGQIGQHIVLSFSPPGCLRVLEPFHFSGLVHNILTQRVNDSRPSVIGKRANIKNDHMRNINGELGWCHYFQLAELASQYHDWEQILDLTNEVKRRNLKPTNKDEWTPFLRGLHKIGDPKVSYDLLQYIELTSSLP